MLRCSLLLLIVVASACQASDDAAGPVPSAAPEAHFVGADGVRLEVPAGWYESPTGSSSVVEPVTRLAVSSGPIRPQESDCQATSFTVAENAVAIVLLEWLRSETPLPVRPEGFDARVLPLAAGAVECFEGRGGGTQFVDSVSPAPAYSTTAAQLAATLGPPFSGVEPPPPTTSVRRAASAAALTASRGRGR